ncbi:MAG: helix-turn-helix domain-containing protein [Candidatus Woesearchaeota archaeon]|nr:helix-turn-helix domain-containing protein [Candidatus Woesearchaeota archaeon]
METPQEIEVWLILPAIRRQFVIALKKYGIKQKEIARMMGITEPAVSQYLNRKRGDNIEFGKIIMAAIEQSAKRIVEGATFMSELQSIMRLIKKSRFICEVCQEHNHTDGKCDICYR